MDKNEIRELIRIFDKSEISKLKIKDGEFSIEMQKVLEGNVAYQVAAPTAVQASVPAPVSAPVATPAAAPAAPSLATNANSDTNIKSPMVGTFYRSPAPGAAPFANIGDVIRKGKTIGIIEAMKIMNEIEAEFDCKIVKILVEDGQPVEFDMPIFAVEKV